MKALAATRLELLQGMLTWNPATQQLTVKLPAFNGFPYVELPVSYADIATQKELPTRPGSSRGNAW